MIALWLLEAALMIVFAVLVVTQIAWPLAQRQPLFPMFGARRRAALKRAEKARDACDTEELEKEAQQLEDQLQAHRAAQAREVSEAIQNQFNNRKDSQ